MIQRSKEKEFKLREGFTDRRIKFSKRLIKELEEYMSFTSNQTKSPNEIRQDF